MQKIRVLAFVLVLGALVASPTSAATNTESFSLAALFSLEDDGLEDDGPAGLNDTVNETATYEAVAGNSSLEDAVGENVTAGTGSVNETIPVSNESTAAADTAKDTSRMGSDGPVVSDLPAPSLQTQRPSEQNQGGNNDENGGGPGMQSETGSQTIGGAEMPFSPWVPGPFESLPETGSHVYFLLIASLAPTHTESPVKDYLPNSTLFRQWSMDQVGGNTSEDSGVVVDDPGWDLEELRSLDSRSSGQNSSVFPETSGSDHIDADRPPSPDRDDPPGSMMPKATTTGGAYPAELPLGSLPLALGVLAGLAILAFRPEYLLKPLQLLGLRLFTHIRKDAVLKHEKRNRIFTIIQQNPGIQAQEIAEAFGLPRNTVRYHMEVLCRHEKVVPFREGKKVFFYPADMVKAPEKFEELKTIPNPIDQAIVKYLERSPDATQREIAAALGLHFAMVSRRMGALAGKGIGVVQRNVMRG